MSKNTEQSFWLDKPQMMGLRGWSLLIPALASSVGFFCFGVLAFSFTELGALPETFRTALVLTGAFSLAAGSEIGTLSNVVEIYRKGERLGKWDKFALGVSVLSTFGAFILAFASLLGVNATWGRAVQLYGPIALGLLAALDSYGGFLEFGLYLNGYDKRMKQWTVQFTEYRKEQASVQLDAQKRIAEQRLKVQLTQLDAGVLSKTESDGQKTPDIEQARAVKSEQDALARAQRFEQILDAYRVNPKASPVQLAETLKVSRTTVYSDRTALIEQGKMKKNGVGYIVTSEGV